MNVEEREQARESAREEKGLPTFPFFKHSGRLPVGPGDRKARQNNEAQGQTEDARSLWKKHVGDDVRPHQCFGWQVAVIGCEARKKVPEALAARPPVRKEIDETDAAVQQEEQR